jgi:hypothetical protein
MTATPTPTFSRAGLKNTDRWMDFLLAGLLFTGSALGNVAAYNGGFEATFRGAWEPWRWQIALLPLVLGVAQQFLLQWRQFANSQGTIADRLTNGRYMTALLVSAAPSLWVFLPVITSWFVYLFGVLGYALGIVVAVVVVLGVDVLQEELLLD